jgi:tetratricopeptide (TPR) repeat protein
VKTKSVAAYSQMDESSTVVRTLKKGQPVILGIEVAGSTGNWCGIRLPGQNADLGYVDCNALEIKPSERSESPASTESVGEAGMGVVNAAPSQPAIHLSLSSPSTSYVAAYDRIKALVIHEDEIDTLKMDQLDEEAKNGSADAMDQAALAHLAAGSFDFSESDTRRAIDQFDSAVQWASRNSDILYVSLVDLSYAQLVRSEYATASKNLARAQKLKPQSAVVAQLLGWADYGLDRLKDAVTELQLAQRIRPNPEVAALLDKVRRDRQTESDFYQLKTGHFILRYEGGATPVLAEDILNALETDYETLQSALQFTPAQPIPVVLYTGETFRDVTRAPAWSGAINDGRIRIPVEGLTSVTPELGRELRHELTHSFVWQMTDGRCPTWLNEGLAQWFEGRRSSQDARVLVSMYQQKKYIPLRDLEGSWMRFPTPLAAYAYAWSLAAVESIIANSGMYGIEALFTRLKEEDTGQMALERALQLSYSDLELQTVQYLKHTYLQQPAN